MRERNLRKTIFFKGIALKQFLKRNQFSDADDILSDDSEDLCGDNELRQLNISINKSLQLISKSQSINLNQHCATERLCDISRETNSNKKSKEWFHKQMSYDIIKQKTNESERKSTQATYFQGQKKFIVKLPSIHLKNRKFNYPSNLNKKPFILHSFELPQNKNSNKQPQKSIHRNVGLFREAIFKNRLGDQKINLKIVGLGKQRQYK